jgi:hypothetical protein
MTRRRRKPNTEVLNKENQVVELRRQGLTWQQIADTVGYSAPMSAYDAWHRANRRIVADGIDDIRKIEQERLDIAQAAIWPEVIQGEIPAVNTLLKIMERRSKLLGLDTPVTQTIRAEVITYDANDIRSELARIIAATNTGSTNSGTSALVGELEGSTEPTSTGE